MITKSVSDIYLFPSVSETAIICFHYTPKLLRLRDASTLRPHLEGTTPALQERGSLMSYLLRLLEILQIKASLEWKKHKFTVRVDHVHTVTVRPSLQRIRSSSIGHLGVPQTMPAFSRSCHTKEPSFDDCRASSKTSNFNPNLDEKYKTSLSVKSRFIQT